MTSLSRADLNNGTAVGPQGEGMDSPSNFSTYPAYKDSGIEWLGEVPEHWKEKPFFSLVSERCESNAGMKQENLLSLSYGRIVNKDINSLDGLLPASFETYQVVHPGDIVFRLTDLQNDKRSLRSAIVREAGIITSAYLAGVCRGIFPEFASFLFRAYDSIKVFYSMGGGLRQSMKYSDMKWLPIFLPEWQEQTQIARFLDHETARIDALIEEQQRLIELLKEKRQAVISHAVTKGLDPTVPMKDSGVEWLGEVPAHWALVPFGLAFEYQEGPGIMAVDFRDEGVPLVRISGVQGRWVNLEGCNYLEPSKVKEKWAHFRLDKGDLIISGSASMGLVSEVGEDAAGAVAYTGLIRLKPRANVSIRDFIRSVVGSYQFHAQIDLLKAGSTIQHFGPTHLSQMKVVLPPVNEQAQIAAYVDTISVQFDELLGEAENTNALLQERRSALISAAVTGKIDVRGWQPPARTQAPKLEVAEAH